MFAVTATEPLDAAARRLERLHPSFGFVTSATGDGWTTLADAAAGPGVVADWLDRLDGDAGGHRNVAASYLVLRLTGRVATALLASYLVDGRGLPLEPSTTQVHFDGAQFDRLALTGGDVDDGVGAGDVARRLHTLLAPVIDAAAGLAPYGVRTMWSSVADRLGSPAVLAANAAGLDPDDTWRRTRAVVDELVALGAPVRRRPRMLRVPWSGGVAAGSVKGTCCLKYVVDELRPRDAAQQPAEFCGGCPYVDDEVRVAKRRAALERRPS
ncbi:hypothetical protein [Jiangella alba]|uniref:Ferric iron reductase FhuF-like transporter n=1 Tax=Jiangella alba TaxID=561176 RepID=A0A1H5LIL3_9ACTN|nr:hypothetical protein [Jiangella alba]SEE76886.1 hypothetical protein SAMN04488561_2623 [Jiangella alba]